MEQQRLRYVAVAATFLLFGGGAIFASVKRSSTTSSSSSPFLRDPLTGEPIRDPYTGEPIRYFQSDSRRRRNQETTATCENGGDEWHPATGDSNNNCAQGGKCICTNTKDDINPAWRTVTCPPDSCPKYLSSSGEECCEKFFGFHKLQDACVVENVCDEQTGQQYWHMSVYEGYTCTNSQDYPPEWDYPINRQNWLHDTVEECCRRFVDAGRECNVVDVNKEEEWSCDRWHLSIELKSDGKTPVDDPKTCTNTGKVHDAWKMEDYQQYYIDDSHESCCERWDIPMEECKMNDACAEETTTKRPSQEPTPPPTNSPSKLPTNTPTHLPTNFPTRSPTRLPTDSPTVEVTTATTNSDEITQECEKSSKEGHWHIDKYGDSLCTNTNDYPEPWHNIRDNEGNHVYLFDTSEECKSFFTKHSVPPERIKTLNVCDSNCCSYMEEHGFENTHHCQEDCSAAETDQTAPDADVIECEMASRYYHPPVDMSHPYCTNSDDYPHEAWDGTSYTHDSGENCCAEFFQGHPECEVVSVCSSDCCSKANEYDFSAELCQEDCFTTTTTTRPPTCDNYSRYWHPAKDGMTCTNDMNYVEQWRSMNHEAQPRWFYKSAEDCCSGYFGFYINDPKQLESCKKVDVCPDDKLVILPADEPLPTSDEMEQNWGILTPGPTQNPTSPPSNAPTSSPTALVVPTYMPTGEVVVPPWYPKLVRGQKSCVQGNDYDPNYAIFNWLFESGYECCVEFDVGDCHIYLPKEEKWYPHIDNGEWSCAHDKDYPTEYLRVPNAYLFDTEGECCTAFEFDHCIPREPGYYPNQDQDGVKDCIYGEPPVGVPSFAEREECCGTYECPAEAKTGYYPTIDNDGVKTCTYGESINLIFDTKEECCEAYPEACPTTASPSKATTQDLQSPTRAPSGSPTKRTPPSQSPTKTATEAPTRSPTRSPSSKPTNSPTKAPTHSPSDSPTKRTNEPTPPPSQSPTKAATEEPSRSPTRSPTLEPTSSPTKAPTHFPTGSPTRRTDEPTPPPSQSPTKAATEAPTRSPTRSPTLKPTSSPTKAPTHFPTGSPTKRPSQEPTPPPTNSPSKFPTNTPTHLPTNFPTRSPTRLPTDSPTKQPVEVTTTTTTTSATTTTTTAAATTTTTTTDQMEPNSDEITLTASICNRHKRPWSCRGQTDPNNLQTKICEWDSSNLHCCYGPCDMQQYDADPDSKCHEITRKYYCQTAPECHWYQKVLNDGTVDRKCVPAPT